VHQVRIVSTTLICAARRAISVDVTSLLFRCVFDTASVVFVTNTCQSSAILPAFVFEMIDRRVNDSSVRRILDDFHDPPVCGKSALFGQSILREIAVNLSEKRKREAGGTLNARNNFLSRQSQANNLSAFKEINNSNNLED